MRVTLTLTNIISVNYMNFYWELWLSLKYIFLVVIYIYISWQLKWSKTYIRLAHILLSTEKKKNVLQFNHIFFKEKRLCLDCNVHDMMSKIQITKWSAYMNMSAPFITKLTSFWVGQRSKSLLLLYGYVVLFACVCIVQLNYFIAQLL